jgi:hypothetical protein
MVVLWLKHRFRARGDCTYGTGLLYFGVMTAMKTKKTVKKVRIKNQTARITKEQLYETDSTYFLKLVVFVLLGTLWLKFSQPVSWFGIALNGIPLGMLIGLVLVNKFEKYQSDRKIWYAILLVVTIICYFVPAGIII